MESSLIPAVLETDSLGVVAAINSPSNYLSEVGLVIFDIVELLGFCLGSKVQFVPRSANIVVHTLARFALSVDRDCFWIEDNHVCLVEALVVDNQVSS
ncbi:hypothetical protein ACOSQ3_014820 [Xanthoceras sorbifolium]